MPRVMANESDKSQSGRTDKDHGYVDATDEDATNLTATVRNDHKLSEVTNGWTVATDDATTYRGLPARNAKAADLKTTSWGTANKPLWDIFPGGIDAVLARTEPESVQALDYSVSLTAAEENCAAPVAELTLNESQLT